LADAHSHNNFPAEVIRSVGENGYNKKSGIRKIGLSYSSRFGKEQEKK